MKPETRLDSAVFQLTPTRTRCDLVILANGKKEKIASGLLNPFLAHLKTAQDQIEKGGYSVTLEPSPGDNQTAEWFTKGTMERFVRFVSTPEVLERVHTIESEIIQIEEAIAIQGNENIGFSVAAEDHQTRSSESNEGSRSLFDSEAEKAIVPYKPGDRPLESNGSTVHEENSKVQLLRVLETRKSVLQKEQGMAFQRAIAAGFGMDNMAHLISFSECFGALRLRDACLRFMELWKRKRETDLWLEGMEIEAAEAMSSRSDFSSMNASGVMLSGETSKLKEFREAWSDFHVDPGAESNGKTNNEANADANSDHVMSDHGREKRPPMDPQAPLGPHEYYQFQHPMFPQWPLHSTQGAPVFQAYPMQGMPYYQNYPGNGAFFQPPYSPMEDPRFNATQRMGRRHSMDSKESNLDPDAYENTDQGMQLESDKEVLASRESRRKGKTRSGMVVIRNINYITSKRKNTTGSESQSDSSSETDEEGEDLQTEERKQMNSVRSSRKKGSNTRYTDTCNSYDKGDEAYEREGDGENWQAFQNFLLRDDEESTNGVDRGIFSPDKEAYVKRQQVTSGGDSTLLPERDFGGNTDRRISEFDIVDGKMGGIYKHRASNDELAISHGGFLSSDGRESRDSQSIIQFTETNGGSGGYRRMASDDFMIYGRQNESGTTVHVSDPLAGNEIGLSDNVDRSFSNNLTDESFMVPFRSSSHDQIDRDCIGAIDMDSEFPSIPQRTEDSSGLIKIHESYEPEDLTMMPERVTERVSIGYDPAMDYELQVCAEMPASAIDVGLVGGGNSEGIENGDEGLKKLDKEKKFRSTLDSSEKRKIDAMKKGKPSRLSPLAEAQVRAERLRAFKADLQKVKKEKEEEELKRLEGLKKERQKRIAARGGQSPVQSPLPSQQTRSRLPTKLSPSSQKSSKFSDTETGSSSPITKLAIKTASVGSSDSRKTSQTSRLSGVRISGNGLSRSVSSLPDLKKEHNSLLPESKPDSVRTRRLSDPKGSNNHHASLKSGTVLKSKASGEPEIKKISMITNLNRTKSVTAHELRIGTARSSSDVVQNKLAVKGTVLREKGSKSQNSETIKTRKSNSEISGHSTANDNVVIEKSVVTVENEVPPAAPHISEPHISEESVDFQKETCDDNDGNREKTELISEYVVIQAASDVTKDGFNQTPTERQQVEQCDSNEVTLDYEELPVKLPSVNIDEKPYHAPYARNSSLEYPCTSNSEFSRTRPLGSDSTEAVRAHVADLTKPSFVEHIPDSSEKLPSKESSSKGFRRLLKFGRKNHKSGANESNVEPEQPRVESLATDGPSTEVHTLKNLISEDDSCVGASPQKVSRPFSLLSPFRSKASEKVTR